MPRDTIQRSNNMQEATRVLHLPIPHQSPRVPLIAYHLLKPAPFHLHLHLRQQLCSIHKRKTTSSNLKPTFAYTVLYVEDVAKSLDFYSKALGFTVRRLDNSNSWGELESGETTIAFTPLHQHETEDLTGVVQTPSSNRERNPIELCIDYPDAVAAYQRAVENGAAPVSQPVAKEWNQKVGYVRDVDGTVVRIGSHVNRPKQN